MNDFFNRLAQRSFGALPTSEAVQPLLPSRFEQTANDGEAQLAGFAPLEIPAPRQSPAEVATEVRTGPGMQLSDTQELPQQVEIYPEPMPAPIRQEAQWQRSSQPVAGGDQSSDVAPAPLESEVHTAGGQSIAVEQMLVQPLLAPRLTLRPAPQPEAMSLHRQSPAQPAEDATATNGGTQPVIQVTIGRVDVRAVPAQPAVRPAPAPRPAGQSLEDYLHGRKGGAR
ncbi:MAG: hypothetical protein IPK16_14760 [Anaerolineales bacterium]|nr:hypothetical protein [Anaerolineales bacterium]